MQEIVGGGLHLELFPSFREGFCHGFYHVGTCERGRLGGEPFGRRQTVEERLGIGNCHLTAAVEHGRHRLGRDSNLGSSFKPLWYQRVEWLVLFGATSSQRGDLVPGRSVRNAVRITPCFDLLASL